MLNTQLVAIRNLRIGAWPKPLFRVLGFLMATWFSIGMFPGSSYAQTIVNGWNSIGSFVDYGSDYYGAAVASLKYNYGFDNPNQGAYFTNPSSFIACHSASFGATYCGLASLSCSIVVNPSVATIRGCISSMPGYQGRPTCPICLVGDPANPLSGNVFESVEDFATVGQTPLTAKRFYNSDTFYINNPRAAKPGRFGFGWRSEYDRSLIIYPGTPTGDISAIAADGMPLRFRLISGTWILVFYDFVNKRWSNTPRHDLDYRISTDGTYWYLTAPDDTIDKYDSTGRLLTVSYRGGYVQTLTYDASGNNTVVADNLGRQITFGYSVENIATSLTDPDSHVIQYTFVDRGAVPQPGYPSLWALSTVIYPASSGTPTMTYLYEDAQPGNNFSMTGMVDENGHRYATWTYDAKGRMLSSQLAGGADATTIAYNDTTDERTVTNALSKQSTYSNNTSEGVLQQSAIVGAATAHTAATTQSYSYDSNGFLSQYVDPNGNITKYVHNSIGQETSRTEAFGTAIARTITTSWNSTWREPDQIVQPNVTTGFSYDTSGRLSQLTQTDTTTQTVPYSTNGQTRTWAYTYTTEGLLQTIDGPLAGTGDTTTYAYNASGFVNSITDVLGHVTNITSLNGRGQPLTSVDPNGTTTNYSYDYRGRILSITVDPGANQALTGFTYDPAGNLTQITRPDGSYLSYTYDSAHRVTVVTNNLGETIDYTLDALGNRTATVVKSASSTITKQQSATFDELGRVMADIGAASQTTTHAYDLNNNETSTTDPRSKIYGHAFDALNRLYQETDPDSYHTTLAFDAQGNATSVTDARSLVTSYVRDGFGDVIRQTSPDTGITDFWYDKNSAMTKQVDARSVETDYTNDNAGRVLTKTFPAATVENVAYAYDSTASGNKGVGYLTSVTDQSGSTALTYDALGHVSADTRAISTNSYGVAYTYGAAGNILTETYPSGRIVIFTRDTLGRISGITTKQNFGASPVTVVSGVGYKPFGAVSGLTFGNGLVLAQTYDQDYQLTGIAASGGTTVQNLTNDFDPSGNITSITDHLTSGRTQTVSYDSLNRLATATGSYGPQSYTYDGVGNRLTRVAGGATDTYAYSPTANRISTITTGSNVRTFSYLTTGQVSGDQRDASHNYTFAANDNGRNASASLNGGTVGAYLYNAFEQRVQKVAGGVTTQFAYDEAGHLLAEANGSGATQKEYIWLDDMPVAVVDGAGGSPIMYFIHTDQLGTPQKITDNSKSIVWDGVFDPFGNQTSGTGGGANWGTVNWGSFNWGATGPSLTLTNLRFPGQYFDAETALHQNWNRDYDPILGRYAQSDPNGIMGGINTYQYANSNPSIFQDTDGLAPRSIPFRCPECTAPHGGVRGNLCPDCYSKANKPKPASECPEPPPISSPQPKPSPYAPPPYLPFILIPFLILGLPAGI